MTLEEYTEERRKRAAKWMLLDCADEKINDASIKALEQEPTTKNDLGVDCISRKAVLDITWQDPSYTDPLNVLTEVRDKVRELPSVTPQEPKPMVEIDLDYVIKQKYIDREVLDKIRAEIEQIELLAKYTRGDIKQMALDVIDKYKAESEETNDRGSKKTD